MSTVRSDIRALLTTSAINKALELAKGVAVMRALSPEAFGILNVFNQINTVAKYGDLGFIGVVERDYNFFHDTDPAKAKMIRSVGYTAEFTLSAILSAIVIAAAWMVGDHRFDVFIATLTGGVFLFFTKILRIYNTTQKLSLRFKDLARFNLYLGLLMNVTIIATLPLLGLYSPIIFSIIATIIVILIYRRRVSLDFNWRFDRSELTRQIKVGIVLSGLTILTGAWAYTERLLISKMFGLEGLGLYSFSFFFVGFFQYLLFDFVRPLVPRVKQALGRGDKQILKTHVVLPMLLMGALTMILVLALKFLVPILVRYWFPKYEAALPGFQILIWSLVFIALNAHTGYLLVSPGIEMTRHAYFSSILYLLIIVLLPLALETRGISLVSLSGIFLTGVMIRTLYQDTAILTKIYGARRGALFGLVLHIIPFSGMIALETWMGTLA